jgi:GNAT superfamily N-acetyltransferase
MNWHCSYYPYIRNLNPEYENLMRQIPFLNIDSLLIPSPYILDKTIDIDYGHSFVWDEEGELLGYLLVYSNPDKTKFHIYKQVTSPFGRGKGIGSAFLENLANTVDEDSRIYLYVWEKLLSSVDFFRSKGFACEDLIVYRKMKFQLLSVTAGILRDRIVESKSKDFTVVEELSKVRHDAKKSFRVLLDMASMLSEDNFHKVTEDINRETTAILNTLNAYEDKLKVSHAVSIKELITERVIPYIEAVSIPCEIRLNLESKIPNVSGNYMNFSRALINIVSNALDAIAEADRPGLIEFRLAEQDDSIVLTIQDNGIGIDKKRLEKGANSLPLFVGKTTKPGVTGEGVGTRQIYSAFGPENIHVESRVGEFTRWSIRLSKVTHKETDYLTVLGSKYLRFIKSTQRIGITRQSSRSDVSIFIWQLRQMELFCYDLVYHFSRHNNVRDIFQNILIYRFGGKSFDFFKTELRQCRIDDEVIRSWLMGMVRRISRNETYLAQNFPFDEYKDVLFQSYGQAIDRTMVFTLDPESGRFFACDRKLAEHLDFVPYLCREPDQLLRGEFIGDLKNVTSPIVLGVWSVKDLPELYRKLRLLRQGARQLLQMGLEQEKRLSFYNTTYNSCDSEIDTFKTTTLQQMANMEDDAFDQLITSAEDGLKGLVFAA